MTTPSSAFDAPPPYSNSASGVPLYETAASLGEDSSCLPPYQSRTERRYHPYRRILSAHRQGGIPPQASANHPTTPAVTTPTPPPMPQPVQASTEYQVAAHSPPIVGTLAAPLVPLPHLPARDPGLVREERRQCVNYHFFLFPEILRIICAELEAMMRIAEVRF